MRFRQLVHLSAEAEFLEAVRYYGGAERGIGEQFDVEVARAVEDIQWNPDAWPKFPGWDRLPVVHTRKVEVFPYRVVYFVRDDELVIVAFAHQRRRPGYWRDRLDD